MNDNASSPTSIKIESIWIRDRIDNKAVQEEANNALPYFIKQLKVRFLMFKNFTYIIVDKASRQAAIVDPSWEFETIASVLDELNVALTAILLTHSHVDHVHSVKPLLKRYPAEVYMSGEEIDYYQFRCDRLNRVHHQETIALGQTRFLCLLTTGHTAGGICYLLPDSLFTGDTIFTEGCGICNAPGGDAGKMFQSVKMIKNKITPDVRIYPAHSFGKEPGDTLRSLLKENIYFQFEKKEQFVAWRMRSSFLGAFNFR